MNGLSLLASLPSRLSFHVERGIRRSQDKLRRWWEPREALDQGLQALPLEGSVGKVDWENEMWEAMVHGDGDGHGSREESR